MSYQNHRHKRDSNHKAILDAFKASGGSVMELQAIDAFCYFRGVTVAVEIKSSPTDLVYRSQLETLAKWGGWSAFVTTYDELMEVMRDQGKCLTPKEKQLIQSYCQMWRIKETAKDGNPQIKLNVLYREILKRQI